MLSLAIQLYTMPIQLYHYFTFPMLGIFLNLIVIPLLTYAAGSGLLALGIYSIAFAGGKIGEWAEAAALRECFRLLGCSIRNIRNTRNIQNSGKCMYVSGALYFSVV